MTTASSTRIERIPGERQHSVEFLAFANDQLIAVCPTRNEAQEALDEYLSSQHVQPLLDLDTLHTALVERRLVDAVMMLAHLSTRQVGLVAQSYTDYCNQLHGYDRYTTEQVCQNFQNAVLKHRGSLYA